MSGGKEITTLRQKMKELSLKHSTICDLPDEVLEYILYFLRSYYDLTTCTLVCRQWYSLTVEILENYRCFLYNGEKETDESTTKLKKQIVFCGYLPSSSIRVKKASWEQWKILISTPVLTLNISTLEIKDCSLNCKDLVTILSEVDNLEFLIIIGSIDLPNEARENKRLNNFIANQILSQIDAKRMEGKMFPLNLKRVRLELTYVKVTNVVCNILCLACSKLDLVEFHIAFRTAEIIQLMIDKNIASARSDFEKSGDLDNLFEEYLMWTSLLKRCQHSLRKMSISCSIRFPPLHFWKLEMINQDGRRLIQEQPFLTLRLFEDICQIVNENHYENQPIFGELEELTLGIPILRSFYKDIPHKFNSIENNILRKLLPTLRKMKKITFHGTVLPPPSEPDTPEIYSIPLCTVDLVFKIFSDQVGSMRIFKNKVPSLAMEYFGGYWGKINHRLKLELPWQEHSVLENIQQFRATISYSDLISYSVQTVVGLFRNLTSFILQDPFYHHIEALEPNHPTCSRSTEIVAEAEISDFDLQLIMKSLQRLKILHLQCFMKSVTDFGLTGVHMGDSRSCVDTHWFQPIGVRFSSLPDLECVRLNGLGELVTNISTFVAFDDCSKLKELHLNNPMITTEGILYLREMLSPENVIISSSEKQ